MYCLEPASKKPKMDCDSAQIDDEGFDNKEKSPVLENKERSFRKCLKNGSNSMLKRLSKFPRTVMDGNEVESKFFSTKQESSDNNVSKESIEIEDSPERVNRNPFKVIKSTLEEISDCVNEAQCSVEPTETSQKENSLINSPVKAPSPVLEPSPRSRNSYKRILDVQFENAMSEDSVIENTYPMENLITPTDSQVSLSSYFKLFLI